MSIELTSVCMMCGNIEHHAMGFLGNRAHYRCRQCGWMWSEKVSAETREAFETQEGA